MSMIKAQKLQKSYGSLTVLSDVSFSLGRGQKVALVGHNGTGKTTILKIVAGLENQDVGKIEIASDVCIGYLPQDTSLLSNESVVDYLRQVSGIALLEKEIETLSVELSDPQKARRYGEVHSKYEHLGGYSFAHKVEVMLSGFGLEDVGLDRLLSNLSSGQKSKVTLAGILLKGVDLLLLDEPTNNLDLPALIWLEDFLKKSEASCIIVSHDRRFLDKVVRKIFELDWHTRTLIITGGTYSDYLEMMAKRIVGQKEEYRLQRDEIERLTEQAREKKADATRGSHWSPRDNDKFLRGFKRDRAGKSSKAAKAIEKRVEQMDKVERPAERKLFEIPLEAEADSGALDIRLTDIVAGYFGIFSIGPLSFEMQYGDRVGILGLNGTGKSTLLKTITGQMSPLSGEVEIGSGIRIGNMMQEHETLPREYTLLAFLVERAHLSQQDSFAKLSKFGFDERQARLPINTLSPGGRARLLLAMFSAQSVNTLVLDEPTNHLDLEVLDALEETVKTYRGTILLVSHDRYFLEKASLDATYVLSDGVLTRIPDYNMYVKSAEERARKLLRQF
ncbi:MAG: ABC transporter related protein [Parcubacteria group bacterium GW2011_GWA2_36_10]|nr:MAG: ABC transporter related protein [Parcubacteria group bacterium GW2011_GWA2_36_10]